MFSLIFLKRFSAYGDIFPGQKIESNKLIHTQKMETIQREQELSLRNREYVDALRHEEMEEKVTLGMCSLHCGLIFVFELA